MESWNGEQKRRTLNIERRIPKRDKIAWRKSSSRFYGGSRAATIRRKLTRRCGPKNFRE